MSKQLEERLLDLHTQQPGKVVLFYPDTYEADVQLMCRRAVPHVDGGFVYEETPIIPRVQICPLGNDESWMKVRLKPGDFVWVMSPEVSTAEFIETGEITQPAEVVRHGLLGSIAIPFMIPKQMMGTLTGPQVSLAGGADYVALAGKVDAQFEKIKSMFSSWVVAPNDGGAALKAKSATLSFDSVAAEEVKAT